MHRKVASIYFDLDHVFKALAFDLNLMIDLRSFPLKGFHLFALSSPLNSFHLFDSCLLGVLIKENQPFVLSSITKWPWILNKNTCIQIRTMAATKMIKTTEIKSFFRKELDKLWKNIKSRKCAAHNVKENGFEPMVVQHMPDGEHQNVTEPHLIHQSVEPEHADTNLELVKVQHTPDGEDQSLTEPDPMDPQHPATIKPDHDVEEFLRQKPEFQDPDGKEAEGIYDLYLQLSKMTTRGAEALSRLRDVEEALIRQRQEGDLDRLILLALEEENNRLVAKVAQAACELNMQERAWQEKFHQVKSLNNDLLHEREKAWEMERAALNVCRKIETKPRKKVGKARSILKQ